MNDILPNTIASSASIKRPDWRYLGGVFVFTFAVVLAFGYYGPIPFDAGQYWVYASLFVQNGHFSLLNYSSSLRGYLFPLLLMVPKAVAYFAGIPPIVMSILLGSLVSALVLGWMVPTLYAAVRPTASFSPFRRIAFALMGLFFWFGYFNYTLSDFPAVLALGGTLLFLHGQTRILALVVGGVLLGCVTNIRPVYIISVPLVVLLTGWPWNPNGSGALLRLRNILLVLIGFALPLVPQLLINQKHFQRNTPLVLAQLENSKHHDLFLMQLGWGLKIQKFETAFHSAPGGRNAQVKYSDPTGLQFLASNGYPVGELLDESIRNQADYLRLVTQHPITALTIYLKRLFNGLDQHFSTPYIRKPITEFTWLLPIVNYSLWFGMLLLLLARRQQLKKTSFAQVMILLVWLLPCAVACMLAMENRFLIPLHLLIYAGLCFEWRTGEVLNGWGASSWPCRVLLPLAYVAFVTACLAFSYSIHQQQLLGLV